MGVNDINDIPAEAGVIATLIKEPRFALTCEQLTPHHFVNEENALMYHAISELAKRDIDEVDAYNIQNILRLNRATKDRVDTVLTIRAINDMIANAEEIARKTVEDYKAVAEAVLDAAFRRETYRKLVEMEHLCVSGSEEDIAHEIYSSLDEIIMQYSTAGEMPEMKDVIDQYWDEIRARQRGETEAIEFCFPSLNEYVVLEPGECCLVGAPMKTGKSAMLLTCTIDLLRKNKSVLVLDSEISTKLYVLRMISHITKIPFKILRDGKFTKEDEQVINDAIEWIKTRKFIHKYIPTLDDSAMYLAAKRAKYLIDIDVIVVDYLKANTASDLAFETYSNLGRAANTLKNKIAGDLQICALTAAQTTMNGDKLADSARIAREVSTVLLLTDKTPEEIERDGPECGTKKLHVKFNRNGSQMSEGQYIDLSFQGSTLTYSEAPKQHQVEVPY